MITLLVAFAATFLLCFVGISLIESAVFGDVSCFSVARSSVAAACVVAAIVNFSQIQDYSRKSDIVALWSASPEQKISVNKSSVLLYLPETVMDTRGSKHIFNVWHRISHKDAVFFGVLDGDGHNPPFHSNWLAPILLFGVIVFFSRHVLMFASMIFLRFPRLRSFPS